MRTLNPRVHLDNYLLLAGASLVLGMLAIWLLSNGYILDIATERWARVLSFLDAENIRIEYLGFDTPPIPLISLIPFYFLPGEKFAAAPYIVSVLAASTLLVVFYHHLGEAGISTPKRLVIITLAMIHPGFLWAATSGSQVALTMLTFYFLYRACVLVITEHDLHSYIGLGVGLAVMFFIDAAGLYIYVALLPLLTIIAPRKILMDSPVAVYIIMSAPILMSIASWAYMNWIFYGDPLTFISTASSDFLGGWTTILQHPWLRYYGGEFFLPLIIVFFMMLLAYPEVMYLLVSTRHEVYRFRASFVLFFHPLLAIAIATNEYYLSHPFYILVLIGAGILAELTLMKKTESTRSFLGVTGFLAAGVIGGWWLFVQTADVSMNDWLKALRGEKSVAYQYDKADLELGKYLDTHRLPTLMDYKSGARAVVARGDAKGLMLTFTPEFKVAVRKREPKVPQIAVPNPDTPLGALDALNQRYPDLYKNGMPGYELVYDRLGWRVYRAKDA